MPRAEVMDVNHGGRRVRIGIRRSGDWTGAAGVPAVLIHGLGLNAWSFRRVQERLNPSPTVALDLLGSGASDAPAGGGYSLEAHADRILTAMTGLDVERAVLAGHSLGGGIALLAALKAPERIAGLVLAGSVGYPQPEPPFVTLPRLPFAWLPIRFLPEAFIREGLKQVYRTSGWPDREIVAEYAAPYRRRGAARAYQQLCRSLRMDRLEAWSRRFHEVDAPAIVIHGRWDNVVPAWVPERLARDLPHAQLRFLPNAGHMLPEEEPDAVVGAILELACGLGPAPDNTASGQGRTMP